jgi:hypothetical protein
MPGPLKKVNSIAHDMLSTKFKELLLQGNWPEVNYKKFDGGESFNMMTYSTKHAQFCKFVHNIIVASGFEYGIFHNARNDKYRKAIQNALSNISVDAVEGSDRFKTWCD